MPTTANYILVATLMAPVIVELGAQSGLVIPLIAVHLFVFYYGIMGDVTPPVGLATFAAAAISGEDAIKTGLQGSLYISRTAVLPFVWIFNPQLLLIDVHGWWELLLVVDNVEQVVEFQREVARVVEQADPETAVRIRKRMAERRVVYLALRHHRRRE